MMRSSPIPRMGGTRCPILSDGCTPDRSAIGGGPDDGAIALSVWNGMNWSHVESSSDEEDGSDDRHRRHRFRQPGGLRRSRSDPSLDSSVSDDDVASVPLLFRWPIPADFLGQEARRRSRSNTYNDAEEYEFWRADPEIELHDFLDPQNHGFENEFAPDGSRNHLELRNFHGSQNKLLGCRLTPFRLLASVFVVCMYSTLIIPDPPEWYVAEAAAAAAQQHQHQQQPLGNVNDVAALPKFPYKPGLAPQQQQLEKVVGHQHNPSFALARSAADVTLQMNYVRQDIDQRYFQQPAFLRMSTLTTTDASGRQPALRHRFLGWIPKLITAWYTNAAILSAVAVWVIREQRRRGQTVCEM